MSANYFYHKHYTRHHSKLVQLQQAYGMAGIGVYWCIVEMLHEEGGVMELSAIELCRISYELRTDYGIIEKVVNSGVFLKNDTHFYIKTEAKKKEKQNLLDPEMFATFKEKNGFDYTEEQKKGYENLQRWIEKECNEANNYPEPLTFAQYLKIKGMYPKKGSKTGCTEEIPVSIWKGYLSQLANNKEYKKKFTSVYLCILNWYRKNGK